MGDTLNSVTGGIASGGVGAIPGLMDSGGGGGSAAPKPAPYAPQYQQNSGDNIFQAYNRYLPQSFNQSSPVNDPSAILQAYMKNLPAIQSAAGNTKDTSVGLPALTANPTKANPNTGLWHYGEFIKGEGHPT